MTRLHHLALLAFALAPTPLACQPSSAPSRARQAHSSPITASPDGSRLYVVNPDADSVGVVDVVKRALVAEIALGSGAPTMDPSSQRFDPAVLPRALAVDSSGASLYVTGQRSGRLYAIDTATGAVRASDALCSEPVGVLVARDDASVFVACSQDEELLEVDATSLAAKAKVVTPRKPWSLGWADDGATLLVSHLLGPGVSALTTAPFALKATWAVPDRGAAVDPTEPHGVVRGLYDAVARPGTKEIWVPHLMLGIDTPQPELAFDSTVFPALSILDVSSGEQLARLSVVGANAARPGDDGAFGDVVSGPRSLAFTEDGKYAFVVDTDSEDLLVVDATTQTEVTVVRPLPGHMPEGVLVAGDEVFVEERNSGDVAFLKIDRTGGAFAIAVDGAPARTMAADPMPASLREGQKLFHSANSDDAPITQNHWVACASCHIEGRSDAVTWLFAQGPRDTPSNAGGMLDTGFLFRTADRASVDDYWETIDVEQGGDVHAGAAQKPLLDAITAYVNHALPAPVPPSTDSAHSLGVEDLRAVRARGEAVFTQTGCADCHAGPAKTDSALGNAALDLQGPLVSSLSAGGVLLHDVGTCVTGGAWPDVAHADIQGDPRPACAFDTPALRGLADSAPYFHDGSAATLADVLPRMLEASALPGQPAPSLGAEDRAALLEYLRSL